MSEPQEGVTIWSPQAGRQQKFVSSSVDEAAWIGQAGTGKGISYALDYLYDVGKPLHNAIIFRKAYKDLEDLINKFQRIFPSYGGEWKEQKSYWLFPSGARFWMSYLKDEKDVFSWQGHEFSKIYWDELAQFSRMPYLYMFRNLRCSDPTIIKGVRSGANPDGPGAIWVWDRFPKSLDEGQVGWFKTVNGRDVRVNKEDGGFSRAWFFGVRDENKLGDPDYERGLDMLPTEALRQAHKFGKLVIVDDPEQLVKTEWWEAAVNGKNEYKEGQKAFGVDYSEGGDKTVKYDGRGNQLQRATEWVEFVKHPEMARLLVKEIRDGGIYQMRGGVDTVGTGSGVYTSMQDIDSVAASRVNPIRHKDYDLEKEQEKRTVKLHFQNLQAQIMWKLREDFMFGNIDLTPLTLEEGYYDNLHLLREEVLAFRFRENKLASGEMWISSSEDLRRSQWPDGKPSLGRSPDRAKALAIWNYVRDWTPDTFFKENTPQRGDYGYRREKPTDPVSAYI